MATRGDSVLLKALRARRSIVRLGTRAQSLCSCSSGKLVEFDDSLASAKPPYEYGSRHKLSVLGEAKAGSRSVKNHKQSS